MNDKTEPPPDLDAVGRWADDLERYQLAAPERAAALAEALREARSGGLGRAPEPFLTVLLYGATGVGKSQLINALAGAPIAEIRPDGPTTSRPTIYAHEDAPIEQLFDYGAGLGELARSPASVRRHRREELRNKVLIDAPDIDSLRREHRELTDEILPAVDVVLYVVTAQKYKDRVGWQALAKQRGRRAVAFVMNKWDPEGKTRVAAGVADVDDDLRTLLQEQGGYARPVIFRTSAEYWANRRATGGADAGPPPAGDQLPELEAWLSQGLSASRAEQIQARRRRASWGALAAAVTAATPASQSRNPWRAEVGDVLQRARGDGWQTFAPALAEPARRLSEQYGAGPWPRSPGPFGLYRRIGLWLTSWRKSRASAAAADGSASPDLTAAAGRLAELFDLRLQALRSKAAENRLLLGWVSDQWRRQVDGLRPRMLDAVGQAAGEVAARPYGLLRGALGVAVLTAVELSLAGFLGLTLYRLGEAFVTANYLGGPFFATTGGLLFGLLVGGHVAMACCFPNAEGMFRRRLEQSVRAAWLAAVAEAEATAAKYLDETERLHQEGVRFLRAINAEIGKSVAAEEPADGPAADELFAKPSAAARFS